MGVGPNGPGGNGRGSGGKIGGTRGGTVSIGTQTGKPPRPMTHIDPGAQIVIAHPAGDTGSVSCPATAGVNSIKTPKNFMEKSIMASPPLKLHYASTTQIHLRDNLDISI